MANELSHAFLRGYGYGSHYIPCHLASFIREHTLTTILDPLSIVKEVSSGGFYYDALNAYPEETQGQSKETDDFERGVKAAITNFANATGTEPLPER